MSDFSVSQLWEDDYFLHWEAVEERYREPLEETKSKYEAADGINEATAWLRDNDIEPDALPFQCKLVHATCSYDYEMPVKDPCGRYIYTFDGEGERDALIFPIVDNGQILDVGMLFIDGLEFATIRQKAIWLGGDKISGDSVRLHTSALEWLEAGATGCVYVDPQRRTPLKRLQTVDKIHCNNVAWALEVWDWAFGADDAALERFEIDDDADNIREYFVAQAQRQVISQSLNAKHPGRFNLVMA
ncbi:hypothetical protein QN219_04730 [Sinorhizobium sp. 7-81]|uniref:hypothetical protein n=1 Tax=Sinorhizobium sp. 8-89 TaxID=3049089 RepID=UPI0024C4471F|nr:hypothetical protein [Sinorhizobium sp. 8-89]MDK1489361.1 hypothetical protein [Sinorhizobium sp. 8-89]